jgi:transcriptional regulator GlxA family with amidase domain
VRPARITLRHSPPPPAAGLLEGSKATAHPAFVGKLSDRAAAGRRVVADGPLTTSRGPGTAFEFALALVGQLYGDEKMREVAGPMVMAEGWEEEVEGAAGDRPERYAKIEARF